MWNKFVDIHNNLSDKDFIWFPFQFLKPKPHEYLTFKHTLVMTPLFATYFVIGFGVRKYFAGGLTIGYLLETFAYSCLGFLIHFNLITKSIWNIRVRKLSEVKE